jgi:uncharacterized membrane protein
MSGWRWLLRRITRRLWFRATLLSVLGVATALVSAALGPFIPGGVPSRIGAEAVDGILHILASSLLAVTTFSLATAVQAYGNATSHVTPRATTLLIEDPTTQNALATFIGAFLYSLVGIIALSTGFYGAQGRVVLFVVTLLVVLLVVVALLRWVDHLLRLVRVTDNTERVEHAALRAIEDRMKRPFLGGHPLRGPLPGAGDERRAVLAESIGYVQHVDVLALAKCADEHGVAIGVAAAPGSFVDPSQPLAHASGALPDGAAEAICRAFTIGGERSFDQDPRFGLAVLGEVASRALSPGINDAGTAIDVIGRAVRLLAAWRNCENAEPGDVPCPRVYVPGIALADLFDDAFFAIGRDGARHLEVQVQLQKGLLALAKLDAAYAREAARHSTLALTRALSALNLDEERARAQELAAAVVRAAGAERCPG